MDISSFRLVTPILNLLFPKIDFDSITREVKIKFEEECDYEHEVKNQQDFQKIFSGDDNILIPNVYLEYSSNKLICSEFMEGLSFDEMLETSDQAEKDCYGELLFRFFVRSLFKKGLCYGDFNPGNFAFQNGKLVVMDFGLVKTMGAKDLEDVRNIFRSVSENKVEKFVQTIESMGFAKKSDGKYDFLKHFELFSETTALPWTDSREFTYNEEFFKKEVEGNIVLNPIGRNISIPDQYFLLMRAYIGIVSLLCKMNATRNWAALFKQESAV
jgi:predicted unusual protein kinase regulating ubiquinone biosynthesis (AarF/ABC1/UbiB family)